MMCCVAQALYIAAWVALKYGKIPASIARGWFVVHLLLCGLAVFALTSVVDGLRAAGVLSSSQSASVCISLTSCGFWVMLVLCPHLDIKEVGSTAEFKEVPNRTMFCLNHTSFFDCFLLIGMAPLELVHNARTLMKDSLRKIPVFGPILHRCGSFPVYFKSDKLDDFGVDKEKQEAVNKRVAQHVGTESGRLVLCPEGVVNPTPRVLKQFRLGSFNMMIQHKMPIYYSVSIGNEDTWPPGVSMGGFPAKIRFSVHKYPVDYTKDLDAKALCEGLQKAMQQKVDELYRRYKPDGKAE